MCLECADGKIPVQDGTYCNPTSNPTSSSPTTVYPTTALPTTGNPTTAQPTTTSPTTNEPTTSSPSTFDPTTADPTTAIPTTVNPTTNPTTQSPTFPDELMCAESRSGIAELKIDLVTNITRDEGDPDGGLYFVSLSSGLRFAVKPVNDKPTITVPKSSSDGGNNEYYVFLSYEIRLPYNGDITIDASNSNFDISSVSMGDTTASGSTLTVTDLEEGVYGFIVTPITKLCNGCSIDGM